MFFLIIVTFVWKGGVLLTLFSFIYSICITLSWYSFLLLTTFSSTTERSLQPHDDKLLIGGQQPLTSVCISCFCFFLLLITQIFPLVLQFSNSGSPLFILSFSEITTSLVILFVMTTSCSVALRQTPTRVSLKWQVQQPLLVHSIRWHLLSFRITREFLLNDSHFSFIPMLTIIHHTHHIHSFRFTLNSNLSLCGRRLVLLTLLLTLPWRHKWCFFGINIWVPFLSFLFLCLYFCYLSIYYIISSSFFVHGFTLPKRVVSPLCIRYSCVAFSLWFFHTFVKRWYSTLLYDFHPSH